MSGLSRTGTFVATFPDQGDCFGELQAAVKLSLPLLSLLALLTDENTCVQRHLHQLTVSVVLQSQSLLVQLYKVILDLVKLSTVNR